jgi:hypothetical protein
MSNLEEDLKMALRREEPPPDLADRVLARLSQPQEPSWRERLSVLMRPPRLQWVAVTVMVSVLLPTAALQYRKERQYQAEGERAKQQLLFAVHVAGSRLHQAQKKVLEGGRMDTRL